MTFNGMCSPFLFNSIIDIVGLKSAILQFVFICFFICLLLDLLPIFMIPFYLSYCVISCTPLFSSLEIVLEFSVYMLNLSHCTFS